MEKTKLIRTRTTKGFTQQQVADYLCMDVSNYNRKEKGKLKILQGEWEKMAKMFEVSLDNIYEPEENNHFVFKDSSIGNYLGTNHFYTIPEFLLDNQQKYTNKLEEEIKTLKEENITLISEIENIKLKNNP